MSDHYRNSVFTLAGTQGNYYAALFVFGWITRMLGVAVLLWVVEEPRE